MKNNYLENNIFFDWLTNGLYEFSQDDINLLNEYFYEFSENLDVLVLGLFAKNICIPASEFSEFIVNTTINFYAIGHALYIAFETNAMELLDITIIKKCLNQVIENLEATFNTLYNCLYISHHDIYKELEGEIQLDKKSLDDLKKLYDKIISILPSVEKNDKKEIV